MKRKIILSVIILFVAGGIGYGIAYYYFLQRTKYLIMHIVPVRENNFGYKFIYPLLRYDFGSAKSFLENKSLEQKINTYIQQQYNNQNAESISVYFSNLLTGEWSGVNTDSQYSPGSLMKVLVMMAYYREKQLDPSVLQKTLVYSKEIDEATYAVAYSTPTNLTIGQGYTTEYLMEDMIENSDDGATELLLAYVNRDVLNAVYDDLNIPTPDSNPNYTISPRNYALFLRILYSSTYLSENNSENALALMGKSTFKEGISAGLPDDIVVAQKFGEKVDFDSQSNKVNGTELHDCGIVYANAYPYTLCIMTKAKGIVEQKQLASIIKDISAVVYNYVNSGSEK